MTISRSAIIPLLLAMLPLAGCKRSEPPAPQLQPVRICMGGILAPLPFIAKEKGFFEREGVSVDIAMTGDGKAAMSDFLEGRCDASLTGEFPLVRQSFEWNDLAIIASIASSDNAVKILARKDRGIRTAADLEGKKIGVSEGTISRFFLDQFLVKNRIRRESLTIVNISHKELPEALNRGEIDLYAGSDVAFLKGRKLIGGNGVTFTEPGLTNHAACIAVKKTWLAANRETARKLLKALVAAEKEFEKNPDGLSSMLSQRLDVPLEDLKRIIADQNNRVGIDQVLILAMEDEARWMMETGIVQAAQIPNYLHMLDSSVLTSVNPTAVKLR